MGDRVSKIINEFGTEKFFCANPCNNHMVSQSFISHIRHSSDIISREVHVPMCNLIHKILMSLPIPSLYLSLII